MGEFWRKAFIWLSFIMLLSSPVFGVPAVLTVDTNIDDPTKTACMDAIDNDCSLRGALHNTNSNSNPGELDTIILPAGLYVFDEMGAGENDGATGDLDIRQDVIIEGEGGPTLQRLMPTRSTASLISIPKETIMPR